MCRLGTALCIFFVILYTLILTLAIGDYELKTRYRAQHSGLQSNLSEPNIVTGLYTYGKEFCVQINLCNAYSGNSTAG
ncbi:unnamed protein product, partial [Mesorhabditis spiculigera]